MSDTQHERDDGITTEQRWGDRCNRLVEDNNQLRKENSTLRVLVEAANPGMSADAVIKLLHTKLLKVLDERFPSASEPAKPATVCGVCNGDGERKVCDGCPHDDYRGPSGWCNFDCPPCPACGGSGVK